MKKEYILALITVTLWGTLASCSKLMMGSLTPMAVLFYSSAIASVTLLVVNLCINGPSGFRQYRLQDYGIIAGLGFIGLFLYTALYYTGLNYLTSQIGCIINYMWPMMIILFSCIILREAFTWRKALAILCAFGGVAVISLQNGVDALLHGSLTGVLCCLGAAVCYGFYSVMNKKYSYNQWIMLWVAFTVTAVLSGLWCAATGSFGQLPARDWLWMLWIGAMGDGIAYVLWGMAVNSGNTAKVSILGYLTPFIGLIFGRILLGEHISALSFLGLILIIGGVFVQMRDSH